MPNWCITEISIRHEDADKVKELYNKIREWTSKNYAENGFGTRWLGNIVLGAEIGTIDQRTDTDVCCRGSLDDFYMSGENEINLCTETAYSPMLKMWSAVCDRYLPGAEIIFNAEDSFCSNDEDLIGRLLIDIWENEYRNPLVSDYDYYPREQAMEYLKWVTEEKGDGHARYDLAVSSGAGEDACLEALLEDFYDADFDGVSIHQIERAGLDDFD